MTEELQHTSKYGFAYGTTHDWDCPACVAKSNADAEWRKANNPHRPGTKAYAEWESDMANAYWGCDQRGETYWSM
jgi:hypothetical protein